MAKEKSKRASDLLTLTGAPTTWAARPLVQRLLREARALHLMPAGVPVALDVSFVDAKAMTALNRRHRGKARPTDVLSFEAPESPVGPPVRTAVGRGQPPFILGDLVLCIPVLKAQARDAGHGHREELAVLLVHGFLHLVGYDHERGRGATLLQARAERKLLSAMGFKGVAAGLIGRSHELSAIDR